MSCQNRKPKRQNAATSKKTRASWQCERATADLLRGVHLRRWSRVDEGWNQHSRDLHFMETFGWNGTERDISSLKPSTTYPEAAVLPGYYLKQLWYKVQEIQNTWVKILNKPRCVVMVNGESVPWENESPWLSPLGCNLTDPELFLQIPCLAWTSPSNSNASGP
jgi:hypothetical protein